jgi:ribosomal-protein-alanine N-acetyltransferase
VSAPIALRPLRWWDIESILPLEPVLFPDDAWSAEGFWSELAAGPARWYVVAEDGGGRVIGYAGLGCPPRAAGGDAEVMTVAVAPSAQGGGLGRALVRALLDEAARRGAGRLLLEVRADNAAARALYVSMDFAEVAVRPAYDRVATDGDQPARSVDAVIMSARLPAATHANVVVAPDSLPT